ncbi:SET domain-containing protein [Hirsutella rhossiliensis]|uniref:SET domain-containing protein n=1 Tax=Hirsutella rhossiliensis TaxID=111463 RepID=A0A9P8SLD0_9HYPO|nr:SET domain-containing protein [Hirsutella rhossiliensis]KAH0965031.1 SET domain-containing protein [Hirsutella rhossiliensis]
MDSRDVSDASDYTAFLERIQEAAERASRREGELVRDHPSPEQLISDFMVPPPYTPCVRSASELRPMMVSGMRLEMHHRGTKTLLRVRTPPSRMTAVMAIVEDEQGTAVLLQLYCQPDEAVVPAKEIVRPDSVCIVKEAFLKTASDGTYSLRVDHISDIIWLDDADDRVPLKWRKPALTMSSMSNNIRMQGNSAVARQNWAEAQRLYSSAIKAADRHEEAQLAYLNRSLANLKLGRPKKAIQDATQGGDAASPSEKQLFREARALYELGDWQPSLLKLQALAASHPDNAAVKPELDRVMARLREQQTGEYDFRRMYRQTRSTPPLIDCATFSALVEAFAYSYVADGDVHSVLMNMSTKRMLVGGQAQLLTQIVQKLYHNGQLGHSFADLHRGDYAMAPVSEADGLPVVDSFLIEKILSLNSFGAPRTNLSWYTDLMSMGYKAIKDDTPPGHATCGVWMLASRINHSCTSNCRRSFIGDMQILRATRDLEAGAELLFSYAPPVPMDSYDQAQRRFGHWGFACGCELCTLRKATPGAALAQRKLWNEHLKVALRGIASTREVSARRLIGRLEETYAATATSALRMELWDPYLALGAYMLARNTPAASIKATVRGLEVLGFTMVASPPLQDAKPPRLEVTHWGIVNEYTPWAFFNMYKAYKVVAPELCAAARQLVETAYSMVVGEKETVRDVFPGLV